MAGAASAMAPGGDERAEALLEAAGAHAVLAWTWDGRTLASRNWDVGREALDALRAALGEGEGPRELAADDDAVAAVSAAVSAACSRFCYVRVGGGGVLFGLGDEDASLAGARARGLARLAVFAAASYVEDARMAGAQLTAVGEIVSGIAHDIGTPLNVISGYAESMLMSTPEDAPGRKQVSAILEQTRRIASMVRQMLDIVRPSPEHSGANQPLERFAGGVVQISSHMLRRREVRCRLEAATGGGAVSGDMPRLYQAMFGVLRSAAQAVGPRGQLVLRPVSNDGQRTGIAIDGSDGAGRPTDLSALASPDGRRAGELDDLLLASRVLAERGGGLEMDDGDGGAGAAGLFVRLCGRGATT